MGSPVVVTLGQQYNIGERPAVILYIYINRHARPSYMRCDWHSPVVRKILFLRYLVGTAAFVAALLRRRRPAAPGISGKREQNHGFSDIVVVVVVVVVVVFSH